MGTVAKMRREVAHMRKGLATAASTDTLSRYRNDPIGYAREHLGQIWWSKQEEVAQALVEHQWVFVRTGHGVGKTHLAGGLINWHFDCFKPGITLSTAPKEDQVKKLTWKEVRLQRHGGGLMPRAPEIRGASEDHFAGGYTARDQNSFQGHHAEHLLIFFEEACGIDEAFWLAADGMLSSGPGNKLLAIYNPLDVSTICYQRETAVGAKVITISALDHPNIDAELRGLPKPFPQAVSLSWVVSKIETWCTPILPTDAGPLDFCWPPLPFCLEKGIEPKWYRPGPHFESKVLGRWPSSATNAVWSLALIELVLSSIGTPPPGDSIPEVGCDPARFGDDFTSIHQRDAAVSLAHETHSGWGTDQTAGRLKQLCRELAAYCRRKNPDLCPKPEDIPVKVDCGGGDVGTGVMDQAGDFNFIAVSSSDKSANADYHSRRSELWFNTVDLASKGKANMGRLDARSKADIKSQAMQPTWKVNGQGQSVVEPKEKTKERLGRSPDDMDGVNLAYLPAAIFDRPEVVEQNRRDRTREQTTRGMGERRVFGR